MRGETILFWARRSQTGMIGLFVFVLRVKVAPGTSLTVLLQHVRQVTLDAYQHQDVPFERILEAPPRSLNTWSARSCNGCSSCQQTYAADVCSAGQALSSGSARRSGTPANCFVQYESPRCQRACLQPASLPQWEVHLLHRQRWQGVVTAFVVRAIERDEFPGEHSRGPGVRHNVMERPEQNMPVIAEWSNRTRNTGPRARSNGSSHSCC